MTEQRVLSTYDFIGRRITSGDVDVPNVEYTGRNVEAHFFFDNLSAWKSADEQKNLNRGGSLTRVELDASLGKYNAAAPCTDFEPTVKAGLVKKYGKFYQRFSQVPPNREPSSGSKTKDPRFLADYSLYKAFSNAYIFAAFKQQIAVTDAKPHVTCAFRLIYGVKPSPVSTKLPTQP